ncbi:HNH endonuclease [Candidatus Kuenenbacteria bacterium CG22_combo_CG10-13_8_21_14_all_39_9]|uniref:HNH endonuclease n=1 Tax=Candidatus Kuenenbacteria bacterium CG22_combo_CG10-13_8_21_14_all_39_9 TaxID=1974621 RepID=A0A2H0D022_9BACT|nr:MAG: HNH endonuclease [Candidatus Kuenenbacteria bacterium CG22_combo_CG10-13_8_21_14_all_39_9]
MPNNEQNFIEIDSERFELIDGIDNIPVVDSFVKKNKIGRGSGEARLYVGSQKTRNFDDFFNGFQDKGFFLKKDFEDYLNDAKFEYEQQEQKYHEDISGDWQGYYSQLQNLSNREFFTLERAVGDQDTARYYVRSYDNIFRKYFRSIMLPVISYVSILKIKNTDGAIFFLFRPSLSYSFNPYYHPAKERQVKEDIEQKKLPEREKEQLVKARIGQGTYRQKLLEESSECIITRVNDERILMASHIKPWSVSNDTEKIDHNNGLVLTPTYDKLFDQGFITFENDGTIIISPYISPLNIKKLNLAQGRKFTIPQTDKRNEYLTYHREHIFKK